MRRKLRMPSPGLVVGLLALLVAIGGTAIAGGGGSSTGKIVGYAKVKADGDVVGTKSLNVNDSNVDLDATSAFCFKNLPFNFKGGQATIDYAGAANGDREIAQFAKGNPFGDCGASNVDAEVATANANDTIFAPHPFYVQFYK